MLHIAYGLMKDYLRNAARWENTEFSKTDHNI